jgi:hypothetical protein
MCEPSGAPLATGLHPAFVSTAPAQHHSTPFLVPFVLPYHISFPQDPFKKGVKCRIAIIQHLPPNLPARDAETGLAKSMQFVASASDWSRLLEHNCHLNSNSFLCIPKQFEG